MEKPAAISSLLAAATRLAAVRLAAVRLAAAAGALSDDSEARGIAGNCKSSCSY
jgi:hypothetical protein